MTSVPKEDAETTRRIRKLNDHLRTTLVLGGQVVFTDTFLRQPEDIRAKVLKAITSFTNFNEDNDPYGEHDFVSVEVEGRRFFGKIDYYDKAMEFASPNPADPLVTTRVLTIMCAEDY